MFTGIIAGLGTIKSITAHPGDDKSFEIASSPDMINQLDLGSSIACDGACLTVTAISSPHSFTVQISHHTLTVIRPWKVGTIINLELSLKVGSRMDGHFVLGHVDSTAEITEITKIEGSHRLCLVIPADGAKFCPPRGSISVNGISLTIIANDAAQIWVNIIPYTYQHTNISQLRVGDLVNIEYDSISRYVEQIITHRNLGSAS